MAKEKIAFDANPLVGQKTGIGQLTYEIIAVLAQNSPDIIFVGHYFNFLGLNKSVDLPLASNIEYKQSVLIPVKLVSLIRKIGIQLPFELFCHIRAEIIMFTNFVSKPSLFNSRKILFIHDLCYAEYPEFVSEKNRNYLQKWVKKSIFSATSVVTISEFTKNRIVEVYGFDAEKILVIPVPPKQKISPNNSILKRLNLNDYILFVGTLEPRKNIIKLLESYELLPKNIQDKYSLVLVGGKGWKDKEILQKITEMQNMGLDIIQTGYVSDAEKSALYESSTLALQLSHYEGFGMPVLEAMSYGKPVICSDILVFREIADGVAVFVDKDNKSEISQTIAKVISDKKLLESMSKKSLEHANTYPTWQNVALMVSSLF